MKTGLLKTLFATCLTGVGLSALFVLYGFTIHGLSPIETFSCASEEVQTALATESNLLTTKCAYISTGSS